MFLIFSALCTFLIHSSTHANRIEEKIKKKHQDYIQYLKDKGSKEKRVKKDILEYKRKKRRRQMERKKHAKAYSQMKKRKGRRGEPVSLRMKKLSQRRIHQKRHSIMKKEERKLKKRYPIP